MWSCIKIKQFQWVEVNESANVATEDLEEEFIFSEMSNLFQKNIASSKNSLLQPFIDDKESGNELKEAVEILCNKYSGTEQIDSVPHSPIYSPPDKNNDMLLKLTMASLGVSCTSILLSKFNFFIFQLVHLNIKVSTG